MTPITRFEAVSPSAKRQLRRDIQPAFDGLELRLFAYRLQERVHSELHEKCVVEFFGLGEPMQGCHHVSPWCVDFGIAICRSMPCYRLELFQLAFGIGLTCESVIGERQTIVPV